MTDAENLALSALEQVLDLTDEADWPLIHATVRKDLAAGKYGREFEAAYVAMVDKKLAMRGANPTTPPRKIKLAHLRRSRRMVLPVRSLAPVAASGQQHGLHPWGRWQVAEANRHRRAKPCSEVGALS